MAASFSKRTCSEVEMMNQEKQVIWSNMDLNYDDWREYLMEDNPNISEQEGMNLMYEQNAQQLEDERLNLDIQLANPIIVCADLGLWNGRKSGYGMIESGNIQDCLSSSCDYAEWYVDKLGDLRCVAMHHDGRNQYLYREIKEDVTETQIWGLLNKLYKGTATRADITRVTRRLGDEIARVYGFFIPRMKQKTAGMERR